MKNFLMMTCFLLVSLTAQAKLKVIYGEDNRRDTYETQNSLYLKLSTATAAMVNIQKFYNPKDTGLVDLKTSTLQRSQNLCSTEAFSKQQLAPTCSGFLVGPDILVTAGHCFELQQNACKGFAWIFGYDMKSSFHNPGKDISIKDNVYLCEKVIDVQLNDTFDYTIVKLNRPVVGREPLQFRTTGKVSESAKLVVIGHPSGLPTKIADDSKVMDNSKETTFEATLDTFQGNSGSAVFDSQTGLLEGILIQGRNDYGLSDPHDENSCRVVNRCDADGANCSSPEAGDDSISGEVVFRITAIATKIQDALND